MKHAANVGWYACGRCDFRRYWTTDSALSSHLRHQALMLVLAHHRDEHSGPEYVSSGPA